MLMREGEFVKAYSDKYWEMFNKIDGDFDEVVIRTFKVGLPSEHGLRKSLPGKPVTSLRQPWIKLINTRGLKTFNNKGKGKLRLFFRK